MSSIRQVLTIGKELSIINALVRQSGLALVDKNPEVIITHGGDGYLLEAERRYSGIPKLPIRYNSICKICVDHDTTHAVKALATGTISYSRVKKLETVVRGEKLLALNEISLHHQQPAQAIRFSVQINDEPHIEMAIGDGIIVSTPFGSHAYYRSITKSTFRIGIGLAYNNTTEAIDHMVVRDTDQIKITMSRGPAYLLNDNDPQLRHLETGETIVIHQSAEAATILGLDRFRCPDCMIPTKSMSEYAEGRP